MFPTAEGGDSAALDSSATCSFFETANGKCCPPGLVIRADSAPVVAVEVFVEKHELAEMRIVLVGLAIAVHGSTPILVGEEDGPEAALKLSRRSLERDHVSRSFGHLD